jgi:hypothetical protein
MSKFNILFTSLILTIIFPTLKAEVLHINSLDTCVIDFSFDGNKTICEGDTLQIASPIIADTLQYRWSTGDIDKMVINSSNQRIVPDNHHQRDIFFNIQNTEEEITLQIDIIDEYHKFNIDDNFGGSFRFVKTYSPGATDFGPYQDLYLIYENGVEFPHRLAVYKIGDFGFIDSFKKLSDSHYQITGIMLYNDHVETDEQVVLIIDGSDIVNKEMALGDNFEIVGHISSELMVRLTIK